MLQRDLGTSTEWAAWTISIYLLSASVATPLLGRLGDQFGKDRMLLVTLGLFTLGSILSIFAWNISSLIVFRALQGVGGAVYPLSFSIIRDEVPPARMGVAMGLISSMLGVGGGIGLVMSGVIVDHGSWRLLFVVGAVVGLLGDDPGRALHPVVAAAQRRHARHPRRAAALGRADLHPGRPHRGPQLGLGLGPLDRHGERRAADPA